MHPNSRIYHVSDNASVVQISQDIKRIQVWGRHHIILYSCYLLQDIFYKHCGVFLFLKIGTRNWCWACEIDTSQLWAWDGFYLLFFVICYLYTWVNFYKYILNRFLGVWKRDLLRSLERELYTYKYFYKRYFRKYSRALTVTFILYSQLLPCCILCETTGHTRIHDFIFKLQYYYEQCNCFNLFWKARTFWNTVFQELG